MNSYSKDTLIGQMWVNCRKMGPAPFSNYKHAIGLSSLSLKIRGVLNFDQCMQQLRAKDGRTLVPPPPRRLCDIEGRYS